MAPAESAREDRRQRLLTVGVEAFGTTPYDDVLVSELARSAGVAAGLPFHYFGSKRGYYLAVLHQVRLQMRDVMSPPEGLSPPDAVRTMMHAHIRWLRRHSQQLRDLIRGGLAGDAEVAATFESTRWDGARQILDTMGIDGLDETAQMFVAGWISMKDDVVLAWIDRGGRLSEDDLIESLLALLVEILRRVGDLGPEALRAVEGIR